MVYCEDILMQLTGSINAFSLKMTHILNLIASILINIKSVNGESNQIVTFLNSQA